MLQSMGSQRVGHGFGWTPGVGDGQGGLACCGSGGPKESDMTEQLNWTEYYLLCKNKMCLHLGRQLCEFLTPASSISGFVVQSCPTLCDPINCSTPGFPVLHYLPEFAQTHVHWVSNIIQPSHPLSAPSLLALNLSQHQGLFQWVSSLHQVAKVLELQHQSF